MSSREEPQPRRSFEEQAEQSQPGIVREVFDFLRLNRKWWMTPIIAVLLLVGVLVILNASGVGPFLYALF